MIMSMTTDKTLRYYKYINKWRLEKMRNKDIEHLVNRTVHKVGGKHVGVRTLDVMLLCRQQ